MFEQDTYKEDIQLLNNITSTEANNLLSTNDSVAIYIGRETCPYCRKFAKKLKTVSNEVNSTIYYIDSANTYDNELNSFREKYNIRTVPGFIVKKNNEIEVRCDSSTPEDEILAMIKE